MFDVVGRRKWFYAISLAVTIPGLLFILLTLLPGARLGLQFSIAYRGGTEWTIHFANGAPEPQEVVLALEAQGLPGSEVVTTTTGGKQYTLIRTSALSLRATEGVSNGSQASPAPGAEASTAPATAAPATTAPTTAPSHAAGASASPGTVVAGGAASISATGKLAEVKTALEAAFGPIDEELELTTVGPVVSAELIQQTILLILMGAVASCSGSRTASATSGWARWRWCRCSTT